jgi:hypothetical protein
MRIQPAEELSPITLVRDAGAWPLARRVARWSAWAWKMARRFDPRRQRVPFLGRILLQRAAIAYGRGFINHHWHVNWRPTFQWHHPSIRRLEITHVAPADAGRYPMPQTARAIPAVFHVLAAYLQAGTAFQRRAWAQWTPGGTLIHQQNTLWSERHAALSRQFIQRWHRVEARPDQARTARREPLALQAREGLPRVNVNRPTLRVFRQRTILVEAEPARARQPQVPTASASLPFGGAPPQLDLNKLTDQVMQQIDRRLVIWRERTGRV